MSYVALYRKFRPAVFDDVKGQEAIVTTLKNQIRLERTQHAYLFCGTRGTGKTTVAKILARAVNCEHPVDGNPCGECETCRHIASGTSMNVIEIDAASNNGVDSIREIIDEVRYRPPSGKFKVYIIDEVHMLSTGAFNALLKTLEEPPDYVMFILATTEANKIPITILSRCQRYDFKRIDTMTICARLADLSAREGNAVEEAALQSIARAADGSMRDALSLLDQCLAFQTGDVLTHDQVLDVLGAVDTCVYDDVLKAIIEGNASAALKLYETMIDNGRENNQFVTDFIWYLRDLLMIRAAGPGREAPVEASKERLSEMASVAALTSEDSLMRYIRVLSELTNELRYAVNKRVLTEIAIIRLCRPQMSAGTDALTDRIRLLEEKLEELMNRPFDPSLVMASAGGAPVVEEAEEEEPEEAPVAAPEDLQAVAREWDRILNDVARKHKAAAHITKQLGQLRFDPEKAASTIFVGYKDEIAAKYAEDEEFKTAIKWAIRRILKVEVEVNLYVMKEKRPELRLLTVDEQLKRINMPIEIEKEI
ncbi:MAG: DNA polymerase III subunit gamma/tau [Lachnospiraceae bacterium]|nr:DNA polymerase III subunit gamma/tau [Lachnospiraceae bacterium]